MARDGNGTYTAPANSFNPAVNATTIDQDDWNTILADLETALTASIANDGQTVTSAVIPFASGVKTDTVVEKTGNAGVTIDSVLLKDGRVDTVKGSDIASATTTDIGAMTGNYGDITGTTTITSLGTKTAGNIRVVQFDGILTLTHNATSLILPAGANITTAAGDVAGFVSEGSGNWRCLWYTKATGAALVGLQNVVEDTTPQLGGDLDPNGNGIAFTGATVTDVTGADTLLVSGTAGTNGNLVEWNADGDAVDSGVASSSLGGFPAATGSSTGNAVSTSAALSVAHSLGALPTFVKVLLRCTTADDGYSIGDVILLTGQGGGNDGQGVEIAMDTTNVVVLVGASIYSRNKSTTAATTITTSSWVIDVYWWS